MKQVFRNYSILRVVTLSLLACVLVFSMGGASAKENNSSMKMATTLANLRQEVDDLSSELEEKKEESKGRIRSYATQKAEVEAEIARAQMRLSQLEESLATRVQKTDEDMQHKDVLTPAVLESIGMLKMNVSTGMPFKREERMAELDRLIRQMDEKLLHPVNAFARLWDQTEDEFRLAGESGIYKQVVEIEGQEVLAEVVRIGMVMMYFTTKEGMIGRTRFEDGKWSMVKITNPEEKRQVLYLFDSFKKQIRTGLFTLPGALPEKGKF